MPEKRPLSKRGRSTHRTLSDATSIKSDYSRALFGTHWRAIGDALRKTLKKAADMDDFPHHPHGIGVGFKMTNGRSTRVPCIRFYVHCKLPSSVVPLKLHLPTSLDGIPTDVIEAPPAFFSAPSSCTFARRSRSRPIQGGISAANAANVAGTIGIVCRSVRPEDAGLRFILSNQHVLNEDGGQETGILQPGRGDGALPQDRVASFARTVPISEGVGLANVIDAAVARLDDGVDFATTICSIGMPRGITPAIAKAKVHKHGRTTGYTSGHVDDVSADFILSLSRTDSSRIAHFERQIRLVANAPNSIFAQDGDSGSLVLTKPDNDIIGLLFACPHNGTYAYANPIDAVFDQLELALAT